MAVPPAAAPPNSSTAVAAVVLGILGIILCPLLGPVAWVLGRKAEQEIDGSGGAIGGRGLATSGKVCGIVGTALIFVGLLAFGLLMAVYSSA